jgi:hypothetical protein
LPPDGSEPDPLFSVELELVLLELSDLLSDEDAAEPLLPEEPSFDDFFA